jgi:hypothetical protein
LQLVNERASIRSYSGVIIEASVFILEAVFLILEVVFSNVEANAVVRAGSGARSVHTEAIRVSRGEAVTKSLA